MIIASALVKAPKVGDKRDLSWIRTLPTKGVYTLIILLNNEIRLKVQRLGCFTFRRGYYAYTGSAVGDGAVNLRNRVARHLRKRKVKHWHIDSLLGNANSRIVAVISAESNVNRECEVNSAIKNLERVTVPVLGFGASDCKQNCESHLVYFAEAKPIEDIFGAYEKVFGTSGSCVSQRE